MARETYRGVRLTVRCGLTQRLVTDHVFQRAAARWDEWTGPPWRHAAHLRERRAAESGGAA